jgi:hypothetical protein
VAIDKAAVVVYHVGSDYWQIGQSVGIIVDNAYIDVDSYGNADFFQLCKTFQIQYI